MNSVIIVFFLRDARVRTLWVMFILGLASLSDALLLIQLG